MSNTPTQSSNKSNSQKMKFLDNLFDAESSATECSKVESLPYERSYIRLEEGGKSSTNLQETKEKPDSPRLMKKMPKVFGLEIWVGAFLSFFLLCYIFNFRLIVVLPLLCVALFVYSVMTLGNKYYLHYLKNIRTYIRSKCAKVKTEEDYAGGDYKLMEI